MSEWTDYLRYAFWFSVLFSIVGTVAMPLLIVRMPADYFLRSERSPLRDRAECSPLRCVGWMARNSIAGLLAIAGLIMLFTPGQGTLLLLVALWIADFRRKRKLEKRLVSLPGVTRGINVLRRQANQPPLQLVACASSEDKHRGASDREARTHATRS
ncbi:MAG: hypothetical protein AAGF31_06360 [Planctomycetota bacterium]